MKAKWTESVFSDGTPLFLSNAEPKLNEKVQVRVRFWKESPVEEVWVRRIKNGGHIFEKAEYLREDDRFVYYGLTFEMNQNRMQYQFLLKAEGKIYYYSQRGITTVTQDQIHDFVVLADYHQPDWIKEAVFYQIFPERFCNGDASLNVKTGEYQVNGYDTIAVSDWNKPAGVYEECHCADFYGGDLRGIQEKIPYLRELGVNAVYLNPIFTAPSVHKYDCIDYLHVDPHFGGDEALADLSRALHENGMRMILDISINHTGTAHKWFNKDCLYFESSVGAYHNPDVPERAYYMIHEDGTYECWDGVPELPKLNFASDELRDALYRAEDSVLKKWLKPPYEIDGWRFDVADVMANFNEKQLAKEVWPEIKKSIREENPNAYILAEHWDDCVEFMQGDSWDAPMNYYGFGRLIRQFYGAPDPFMERTEELWPFTAQISAEEFRDRAEGYLSRLPFPFWQNQYNLFDSHDIGRFHVYPGMTAEKYKGAVLALFTMIGVPSVYYGDELSIDGKIGFFEGARYPMSWERSEERGDLYQMHQKLACLRRTQKAFCEGSFRFIYAAQGVIAFARFWERECYVSVFSSREQSLEIELPLDIIGFGDAGTWSDVLGSERKYVSDEDGNIKLTVPVYGALLLTNTADEIHFYENR